MKDVLGSAQPLLLIGMVFSFVLESGCGLPTQEPPPSWPDEVALPDARPSPKDGGSIANPPGRDGGLQPDAGASEEQDAGVIPNTAPEILESWQAVSSMLGGGSVTLRVRARPPHAGSLSFSWQSLAGTFGAPSNTATVSEIVWTAPACGTGRTTHTLQVTLLQSSGLSSSTAFEIAVVCPRWVAAPDMVMARHDHTASLLASGKVLVAGRYTGDALDSTEQYDPVANSWSRDGDMDVARRGHTASVLLSGKVLVTGGYNNLEGILASAELYDQAATARPWSSAGSMSAIRTAHTAIVLSSGKVLITGGFGVGGALTSAELYDPASRSWAPTGAMATGRYGHTATLLPSGKVLIVGGDGASGVQSSAELYDPATGLWSPAGHLAMAHAYHTATLLLSGQVLVAGGGNPGVEIYVPSSNTWFLVESMATARTHHTATLLPAGKVLVVGGMTSTPLASTEVYDPSTRTWSPAASLVTARSHHAACLLPSGKVLVAGGHAGSGPLAGAELYEP